MNRTKQNHKQIYLKFIGITNSLINVSFIQKENILFFFFFFIYKIKTKIGKHRKRNEKKKEKKRKYMFYFYFICYFVCIF